MLIALAPAQADAVLTARGPTNIGPTLDGALNGAGLTGFDNPLAKLIPAMRHSYDSLGFLDLDCVAAESAHLELRRADMVVADWSRSQGQGEIHKLDTYAAESRVDLQGDSFIMPGDNPALVARLAAHGWDLSDERQDERRLPELVNHQRAITDVLPDGARFSTVGVFAQHTVITADGITTRIVERWLVA